MAGDLVAVQKQITIAGVSHSHTYWMKAEDAQKEHDAGTGTKTGETKQFGALTGEEKSTYWKQAAAKAAATKAAPKAKAPEAAAAPKVTSAAPTPQAQKWMSAGQKAAATKKAKAEAAKAATKPAPATAPGSMADAALQKTAKAAVMEKLGPAVKKFGGSFKPDKFMLGLTQEEKASLGSNPHAELFKMGKEAIAAHKDALAKKLKAAQDAMAAANPPTPSSKSHASLPMVKNAISHDMSEEERASLRAAVLPPGSFKSAMKEAGANDFEAGKMKESIDSWAGSANSDGAMRIRGAAVAAMFPNDPDKAKSTFEELRDHPNAAGYSYAGTSQKQKMEEGFADPKVVATVVASAKVAQSMYDEEYITVYRGVSGGLAEKVKNAAKESGSSEVDFDVHALSCWSESPTVAAGFAHGGVVVAMKIHRSSIAASHRVPGTKISSGKMGGQSGGFGKEQEVFVASTGKVRAQIWKG